MALEINKKDLAAKIPSIPSVLSSPESDGVDKYIRGINTFMGHLGQTITQATKLLDGYKNISSKLTGNPQQIQQQNAVIPAVRQPAPREYVEPAIHPKEVKKLEEPKQQEPKKHNLAKAEALFNELHEMVKPHLTKANFITASGVIQMALQPDTKQKIIEKIAERLETL